MEFDEAVKKICEVFCVERLTEFQYKAIKKITERKDDVFINMPTGCGKSLTYQALPIVFDCLAEGSRRCEGQQQNNIVIVVSPLMILMKDQVDRLRIRGISAISLSHIDSVKEEKDLLEGKYSIVYGSPESWLLNEKWRSMLVNDAYSKNICAVAVDEAHIIKHWGKSTSNKHAAFRECFVKLGELRSLISTTFVVLTATATEETKQAIFEVLLMTDPYVIAESPNKTNIMYSVHYINKYENLNEIFKWLTDELIEKGVDCPRTIIYCQTIKQCSLLYAVLKANLGERNYVDRNNKHMVLLEMLHSCSPEANKKEILNSFQQTDGSIRLLVATIAFGMGVDSKGVSTIVHFGPSKNVESYIQETGRAGRNGDQSYVFLLYNSFLLAHVDKEMKVYVKTQDCRRNFLLSFFNSDQSVQSPLPVHLCCDNCSLKCECGLKECGTKADYPVAATELNPPLKTRKVSDAERAHVRNKLVVYHKEIVQSLATFQEGTVKSLIAPQFLLGFSQHQVSQALCHCSEMFSIDDIFNHVEIWDKKHALKIYKIFNEVFGDMDEDISTPECNKEVDFSSSDDDDYHDEDALRQWNEIVNDEELLGLVLDCSHLTLDSTFTDNSDVYANLSTQDIHTTLLPDLIF